MVARLLAPPAGPHPGSRVTHQCLSMSAEVAGLVRSGVHDCCSDSLLQSLSAGPAASPCHLHPVRMPAAFMLLVGSCFAAGSDFVDVCS